eukprot:2298891-Amphidinium_carterae.1
MSFQFDNHLCSNLNLHLRLSLANRNGPTQAGEVYSIAQVTSPKHRVPMDGIGGQGQLIMFSPLSHRLQTVDNIHIGLPTCAGVSKIELVLQPAL